MANTFELISSVTVPSAQTTISFTSIPSTFTDLVLKVSARWTGNNGGPVGIGMQMNTTNHSARFVYGTGSSAASGSTTPSWTTNGGFIGWIPDSSATSNTFGNFEIYLPSYTSSNYKSFSLDTVTENNATLANAGLLAGLWSNTAAITSITIDGNGSTFVTNSTAYLYGIKNS
jgi:hypothetical protein